MIRALSNQHRRLYGVLAIFLLLSLLIPLTLLWQSRAAASDLTDESIQFNHQKHLAADIPCLFCHANALNGPVASLPSLAKCVGCHQNVTVESQKGQADVEILMAHWEEEKPLRWVKTYDQPDFVHFNHRPHIAAGVNCENCHGDVSNMTTVRPAYRINMGFCLDCHPKSGILRNHQQGSEKQNRLTSCATCHK